MSSRSTWVARSARRSRPRSASGLGRNRPFSQRLTVPTVTPSSRASCSWVIPRRLRSSRTLGVSRLWGASLSFGCPHGAVLCGSSVFIMAVIPSRSMSNVASVVFCRLGCWHQTTMHLPCRLCSAQIIANVEADKGAECRPDDALAALRRSFSTHPTWRRGGVMRGGSPDGPVGDGVTCGARCAATTNAGTGEGNLVFTATLWVHGHRAGGRGAELHGRRILASWCRTR